MEPQNFSVQQISKVVGNRRLQAIAVAVLVLVALVILQVSQLNQNKPMCGIFTHCKLSAADIERIQIGLSQSGLSEFNVEGARVFVPKAKKAAYLQAITEQNAIPVELRDTNASAPSVNPFLSRSQQKALERSRKKNDICQMVTRLPFVDQAWLEMDRSDSHSAFQKTEQSAVISIRTTDQAVLTDLRVNTIKRMIDGAVAELDLSDIVVIDLTSGSAYQDSLDPSMNELIRFQQVAFEQQRYYESRIRETLREFPGIEVTVIVDVQSASADDQLALNSSPPATLAVQPASVPVGAGANGFASIHPEPANQTATIASTARRETARDPIRLNKNISVSIDVPQSLVKDLFGNTPAVPSPGNREDSASQLTQRNFNQLSTEIIRKVRPLLPESAYHNRTAFPIAVHLIRQPPPEHSTWPEQAKRLASQHWPSGAVLLIGLALFSVVARKPDATGGKHWGQSSVNLHASDSPEDCDSQINSKTELTQLIDKDPDAAAKVLESWIRDAA